MVQLSEELLADLDKEATRRSTSRSAIVREAIDEYLAARRLAPAVARYVDGYRQDPPGSPDEWGDLEASGDRAGRELAQRLDAEEAQRGQGW